MSHHKVVMFFIRNIYYFYHSFHPSFLDFFCYNKSPKGALFTMKQILLILLSAFNIYSIFNITMNYQHDDLIALLSTRIIILAISFIIPILYFIIGSNKKTTIILSIISIITALIHFLTIALIYI